jgi:hypothetical protein
MPPVFRTKNQPVQKEITTSKSFSFRKNEVSLNFSLQVDGNKQLEDFAEVLRAAQDAVQTELNKSCV